MGREWQDRANRVLWHLPVYSQAHRIQDMTLNLIRRKCSRADSCQFLLGPGLASPGYYIALCYFTLFLHLLLLFLFYGSLQIWLSDADEALTLWVPPPRPVCRRKMPSPPSYVWQWRLWERKKLNLLPGNSSSPEDWIPFIGLLNVGNWTEPVRNLAETRTYGQTVLTALRVVILLAGTHKILPGIQTPGFSTVPECDTGNWNKVHHALYSAVKGFESGIAGKSTYIKERFIQTSLLVCFHIELQDRPDFCRAHSRVPCSQWHHQPKLKQGKGRRVSERRRSLLQ